MVMQRPRTEVGKISEHRMFGIAPKPITKQLRYTVTLAVDINAFVVPPSFTKLPITSVTSDSIRMGIVESIRDLQSRFWYCYFSNYTIQLKKREGKAEKTRLLPVTSINLMETRMQGSIKSVVKALMRSDADSALIPRFVKRLDTPVSSNI